MVDTAVATAIGLLAGGLTTSALVPQAYKIWRTRSAKDISLLTMVAMSLGIVLWIVFGIIKAEIAIIIPNAVALVVAVTILLLKLRHG
jgi:MtN3 and saliva related transmembrane protein